MSKETKRAQDQGVANAVSGAKLKDTLSELELALADWDKIPLQKSMQKSTGSEEDALSADSETKRRAAIMNNVPEAMKRRTKELLDKLKQQIDEL